MPKFPRIVSLHFKALKFAWTLGEGMAMIASNLMSFCSISQDFRCIAREGTSEALESPRGH
jgi:hypothetical protein